MFREFINLLIDKNISIKLDKIFINKLYDNKKITKATIEYLYVELLNMVSRVLIVELHKLKRENKLKGETSEKRFESFENAILSEDFYRYLSKKYPILIEKTKQKINNTINYVYQLLNHLIINKLEIESKFKINLSQIDSIKLGAGDTHNGGKTVAFINGISGAIIYKPHDLSTDIIFDNIIQHLNKFANLSVDLSHIPTINKNEYGFQKLVKHKPCKTYDEVIRYYYRCGCLLAIFYILSSSDMHHENIICSGENPYVVDTETLISLSPFDSPSVNINYTTSVMGTHFLPYPISNKTFDFDISGLCGKNTKSTNITANKIVYPYTDNMQVQLDYIELPQSKNTVLLNGNEIDINDVYLYLIDGFESTLNYINSNKTAIIDCILEKIDDNTAIRQLCRPTRVYATFLNSSYHPDHLKSHGAYNQIFNILRNNFAIKSQMNRLEDEIKSLQNGDIPYYFSKVNDRALYSWNSLVCENYFSKTIKDKLCENIFNINQDEIKKQINIIKMSLFSSCNDPFRRNHNYNNINLNKRADLKNLVLEITEEISKNVITDDKNLVYRLTTMKTSPNKNLLVPDDYELYDGGGIPWLLACVGKTFDKSEYLYMSKSILKNLNTAYIESDKTNKNVLSVFTGHASLLYLNYNFASLLNDNEIYEQFQSILHDTNDYCDNLINNRNYLDINIDYINGISGLIVFLSKVLSKHSDTTSREIFEKLESIFFNSYSCQNLNRSGIAHGLSGIALAFTCLHKILDRSEYLDIALTLIKREKDIKSYPQKFTWCNGYTGILLSRHEMIKNTSRNHNLFNYLKNDINTFRSNINIQNYICNLRNMCLCHGIFGNIDILNSVFNKDFNIGNSNLESIACSIIDSYNDIELTTKCGYKPDTFMQGSSGIAYSLLRFINPTIPSVLNLDIFDRNAAI